MLVIRDSSDILRHLITIMMETEYSLSNGWKISTYILSAAIVGAMLYFFVDALSSSKDVLFWTGLFVAITALFGYFSIAACRSKIVFKNDEIIQYGTFKNKQLFFKEVKGIRVTSKIVVIESNAPNKSNIVISDYGYIKNNTMLLVFLSGRFHDLDKANYNRELTEILNDPEIGVSTEDRKHKLIGTKKVARILNSLGIAIALWLFIYPHPYSLAICAGLIYPFIVLVYFFKDQEVFTLLDTEKKSAYPSLNSALVMPPLGLLIRALLDFDLLYFKDCIMPVMAMFIVLTLTMWKLFESRGANEIWNPIEIRTLNR